MKAWWQGLTGERQAAVIAGVVLVLLLVGFVAFGDPPEQQRLEGEQIAEGEYHPAFIVGGVAALAMILGLVGWSVFRLVRRQAPKFSQLGRDEQDRRRQAGDLLKGDER